MTKRRFFPVIISLLLILSWGAQATFGQQEPLWERAAAAWESVQRQYYANQYLDAEQSLERFVKMYPTYETVPVAYLWLATCQAQKGDHEAADASLDYVVKRFYGSPTWFVAYGYKMSRLSEAVEELGKEERTEKREIEKLKVLVQRAGKNEARRTAAEKAVAEAEAAAKAAAEKRQEAKEKLADKFFKELSEMSRRCRRLPYDLGDNIRAQRPGQNWYYRPYLLIRPWGADVPSWVQPLLMKESWIRQILDMADNKDRANEALRSLRTTFRAGVEMPADWQMGHVILLYKAERAAEAEKTFKKYADAFGNDPRGMALWRFRIEYGERTGNTEMVDAAFDELMKRFKGYFTLGMLLDERWQFLVSHKREDAMQKMATYCLENYPDSKAAEWARQRDYKELHEKALKGAPADVDAYFKAVDKLYGADSLSAIRSKMGVYIQLEQFDKAKTLGEQLLEDKYWSSGTYNSIRSYARYKELADLLEKADKKYGIYPPDDEAAKLIKDLQSRMKDDQVIFMEELGETLTTKYAKTAQAIQGVDMLVDYYYKKVLPKDRQKWINVAVSKYPKNPQTERIMDVWIKATFAEKDYAECGRAIDLQYDRFPGSGDRWFRWRLMCYGNLKDRAGAVALVKKIYGPKAAEGDMQAMGQIAAVEVRPKEIPSKNPKQRSTWDYTPVGDYWLKKAKDFAGTPVELHCLNQAYTAYQRTQPKTPELYTKMMEVIKRFQEQKIDPEAAWVMEFADVGLLLQKAYDRNVATDDAALPVAREAVTLLEKKIGGRKRLYDLSGRLNFNSLGAVLGRLKMGKEVLSVQSTLQRATWTEQDKNAIDLMVATALYQAGNREKAGKAYQDIINRAPWPILEWRNFNMMLGCMGDDPKAYSTAVNHYIHTIPGAQQFVPGLLCRMGVWYLRNKNGMAMRVLSQLGSQYPASRARGQLYNQIEKVKERGR